jgi:HAD superfamily hydrolase (TIGR01509 family)
LEIQHIVFDLGGVLVELDGQPIKNSWLQKDQSFDESWRLWLTSPLVQDFDRGKISPRVFAESLVEELHLNVSPAEFLDWITLWPKDFYPESLLLLKNLSKNYQLSIFSNITSLHWPKYHSALLDLNVVSNYFASFEMGLAKPEPASFQFIVEQLNINPKSILFLDDNIVNVEAARSRGLYAECVKGIEETKQTLITLGLANNI